MPSQHRTCHLLNLLVCQRAFIFLCEATECGNVLYSYGRCVALLLAHGASPFILDHGWQSALHHAVGHGRVQVVNILLRDDMKVATDTGLQVLRHVQYKDAKGQSRYLL